MRDILIDENTEYLFLQYQDDSLEIYDIAQKQYVTGDYSRHTFRSMDSYINMGDEYFILKSYAAGYVFEKESMTVVAVIPSLYGYDASKNNFIIDDYSQYYYVPFYSLEELVQQITKE